MQLVYIRMGLSPFEGAKFKVTNKEYGRSLFWTWIIRHIVPWTIRLRICGIYTYISRRTGGGPALVETKVPLQCRLVDLFKLDFTILLWGLRCYLRSQITYK